MESPLGERAFRIMAENATDIISIIAADGIYRYVSPSVFRVTGYRPEELCGASMFDQVHPADLDEVRRVFAAILRGEALREARTVRRRHRNGEWLVLEVTASSLLDDPDVRGVVVAARDVSDRVRTEERMADERSLKEAMFNASSVGMATFDEEGQLLTANEALAAMLGGEVAILRKQNFRQLANWEATGLRAAAEQALREETEQVVETTITSIFGKRVWLSCRFAPFRHGASWHLLVLVADITKRKETEAALHASEMRFRHVVETTLEAIYIQLDGCFAYLNPAALRLFGATAASQLLGQPVLDRVHPDFHRRVKERMKAIREQRLSVPLVEQVYVTLAGERLDVEVSATPYEHDGVCGSLVSARDITARKKAEAAMRDNERKYRSLVEASQDMVWSLDRNGRITFANAASLRIFGLAPEEMIGRTFTDLLAAEDIPAALASFEEQMRTGRAVLDFETRAPRADGSLVQLRTNAVVLRDEQGEAIGVTGTTHDVTEPKRAEKALQLSEARYRSLVESSNDWIWEVDVQGRYTFSSPHVLELLGYTIEEVLGRTPFDFMAEDERQRMAELFASIVRSGQPFRSLENACLRKDGTRIVVETNGTPFFDASGNLLGYRGIDRDITARKQAAEALARSRNFYLTLFEDFPAMIWRAGPNLKTNYFNKVWLDFTGRTMEDELGRGWLEGVHPDDRARCEEVTENFVRKRKPFEMEYRLLHHSGDYRWVLDIAKPYDDPDGQFAGYIGVCYDITGRHETEERLRLQSSALEAAANGIVITDRKGTIIWVNAAFTALTGYDASETYGLNPRLLKSGLQPASFYRQLWHVVLSGQVWRGELVNRRKDGRLYNEEMTITPVRNPAGEITHFVAIKQDITRQRRASERLREQAALLDLVQESITVRDMTDHVTFWNRSAERMYGWSAGQAMGRTLRELLPDLDATQVREARSAVLLHGQWSGEIEANLHGSRRVLDSKWTLIRDESGLPSAMLCVDSDITEKKRFADHFASAERMKSLGTLVSGIAHDFNNLLMPILGLSDLLISCPQLMDNRTEVVNHLRDINSAARDARDIVHRLREFYRPEEKLESQPLDPGRVVGEAIRLTEPRWKTEAQAEGRTIAIETDLHDTPEVIGSELRLREAITNIILNAVDALPQGGTIAIRVGTDAGQAVIEIRDNGTGMSESVLRRCREPFFSTKGVHGSGLGLSMCHGIVQRHHGTMEIESQEGKGTCVCIRLPARPAAEPEAVIAAASHAPPRFLTVRRVLAIDDDELTRDMLRLYLTAEGYSVETAEGGEEGLALLAQGGFDLLITDRAMPGMSGDQVALQAKRTSPQTLVVLLTGFGDLMASQQEKPPGIDLVLSKPLTRDELQSALVGLLARSDA